MLSVGHVAVAHGFAEEDREYRKENRHVLRVVTQRKAEYLLEVPDEKAMQDWLIYIRAAAGERVRPRRFRRRRAHLTASRTRCRRRSWSRPR